MIKTNRIQWLCIVCCMFMKILKSKCLVIPKNSCKKKKLISFPIVNSVYKWMMKMNYNYQHHLINKQITIWSGRFSQIVSVQIESLFITSNNINKTDNQNNRQFLKRFMCSFICYVSVNMNVWANAWSSFMEIFSYISIL